MKPKLRNTNEVALALEKYRHEVKLQEHVLFSGLKNLRKSFFNSVEEAVKMYTQQWVMIRVMKWVQSALYSKRKKKKKKK
jgi:hypothetical protein